MFRNSIYQIFKFVCFCYEIGFTVYFYDDYVIPGNDDAIRAVKLLASVISDAVLEAKQGESMAAEAEEVVAEAFQFFFFTQ